MRSNLLPLALLPLLFACGSSAPAPEAPLDNTDPGATVAPERGVVGSYRAPHEVEVVCDDPCGWCTEEVEDTMVVSDAGDGKLAVVIELYQTNAHTCSFDGTMAPVPGASGQWRFDDQSQDEGPCTLTLTASADQLGIASEGCRYYCGVRASLDATFSRP